MYRKSRSRSVKRSDTLRVYVEQYLCAIYRSTCNLEDSCNISWQKFAAREGQACGRTYLPEFIVDVCDHGDIGIAEFGCADKALSVCAKEFECESKPFSGLACAVVRPVSTLLPAPGDADAALLPSGPYSSALSAAIAAGAAVLSHRDPHIVGRAAVDGYLVWRGPADAPCTDLLLQNASSIAADLQQSDMALNIERTSPGSSQQSILELMPLLSSVRCDMPGLSESERAIQVPPWLPATHYHVQLYAVRQGASGVQGSGVSAALPECTQFASGRRLFQQDGPCDSFCLANEVLNMIFQSEDTRQNAEGAMKSALQQMETFTGKLSPEFFELKLLPEIGSNDVKKPRSKVRRNIIIALAVAVFVICASAALFLLRRRRRPSPSPRTYVAGAQGAAEPMLPDERREQLKGLLNFLRKKRTEEVTHARTRPLGEPVELGPEPAARTKVEHIVKALLCASAPGPIVADLQ